MSDDRLIVCPECRSTFEAEDHTVVPNGVDLTQAEREGLIEAVQDGNEVEYVEALIASRLTRVTPPGGTNG